MEGRKGIGSGVPVIGAEAPSAYQMAPRSEARNRQDPVSEVAIGVSVKPVSVGIKKRGIPGKYGRDGSVNNMPNSSSAPFSNDFSTAKLGKPRGMEYKHSKKIGQEHLGAPVCTSFMPHLITVNSGEDIKMKIISFSQEGPRAVCILSASGVISNVTLRHPNSSRGTLTYEGHFQILSLSGSFTPTAVQGTRSRSGGLSVSFSSPYGHVVGGEVAGSLVAASPVKVVVATFLPGKQQDKPKKPKSDCAQQDQKPKKPKSDCAQEDQKPKKRKSDCAQQDQKPKKPKSDCAPVTTVTSPIAVSIAPPHTNGQKEDVMCGHLMQNSGTFNTNPTPPSGFHREDRVNMHSMPGFRIFNTNPNPPSAFRRKDRVNMHSMPDSGTFNTNPTPPSAFRREDRVNMHSMPNSMKPATDIDLNIFSDDTIG